MRAWRQQHGANDYVPDTHRYDTEKCEYSHGGNVLLHDIIIPSEVEQRDGKIYCRKCNTFGLKYDRSKNFKALAGAIRAFGNHEQRCKGKQENA